MRVENEEKKIDGDRGLLGVHHGFDQIGIGDGEGEELGLGLGLQLPPEIELGEEEKEEIGLVKRGREMERRLGFLLGKRIESID